MALSDFKKDFLNESLVFRLSGYFKADGCIDFDKIRSLDWGGYALDDKNIFDEDADCLSLAINGIDADSVFLVRSMDVSANSSRVECLVFESTKERLEEFQRYDFDLELPLLDCVLFDGDIRFLVYRPATFDKDMMYFGPSSFLSAAVCGEGWRRVF
ncbi:hypothetical protein [Chromobacterium haemolyticum]|uniref:hypothetical protein n=1 Tax=Chromobacterium haemolyticum TaxID=394935 RepID=UPI00307E8485